MGFDEGLPLANKRPKLVGSEVHPVEVGQAIPSLNLINAQLDFAERLLLFLVEVGEGEFDDATFQGVVCVF